MDIFDDLEAEQDRIEDVLDSLDGEQWEAPSAAAGWTVTDVVTHLAQTEEAVVASASSSPMRNPFATSVKSLDEAVDQWVRSERADPKTIFERWRTARRKALVELRSSDPDKPIQWAAGPIRPKALATTRLAEHWAHGLDITTPLAIAYPDTDRLRHVAWLAHRSLPYAFGLAGAEPREICCELTGPNGDPWTFGPRDADSSITGSAAAFCRVGARRLSPQDSGLVATGPHGAQALRVLRNYAA